MRACWVLEYFHGGKIPDLYTHTLITSAPSLPSDQFSLAKRRDLPRSGDVANPGADDTPLRLDFELPFGMLVLSNSLGQDWIDNVEAGAGTDPLFCSFASCFSADVEEEWNYKKVVDQSGINTKV